MRTAEINRETKETKINIFLNLDGGEINIKTGIGFFDHMLESFAVHSGFGLNVSCRGDLHVDCHHTIEDVGIVLGKALNTALGDKSNINRYGTMYIPMDESLAFCSIDISGRAFLVFNAAFNSYSIGQYDTCVTEEFFRALAINSGITLHLNLLYGANDHHKTEALFKAAAHALKKAVKQNDKGVLSSKGVL